MYQRRRIPVLPIFTVFTIVICLVALGSALYTYDNFSNNVEILEQSVDAMQNLYNTELSAQKATYEQAGTIVDTVRSVGNRIAELHNRTWDYSETEEYLSLVTDDVGSNTDIWSVGYMWGGTGTTWEFQTNVQVNLDRVPMTWVQRASDGALCAVVFGYYNVKLGLIDELHSFTFLNQTLITPSAGDNSSDGYTEEEEEQEMAQVSSEPVVGAPSPDVAPEDPHPPVIFEPGDNSSDGYVEFYE